ncbi:small conductance mechanosensitive channel [Geosporobacter subterraneus DSM 17957]|uniref:Small conductance mechanosensitive channel n=1 Tax=Geosporobacter subterraneus DSM 17957 TaxID=1121919 RepID=A0A1M6KDG1_9FIRM|nr:mechanosensitive ion channel family protein [Geosporobacter subterraneus]SHJ56980.1 small conductance mechanosensitive channel [Geosporobacter subterraneus DSM 17957]
MEGTRASINGKIREMVELYGDPERLTRYSGALLKIIFIFIAAKLTIRFINIVIDKFFENREKLKFVGEQRRFDTLKDIIKSIFRYIVYFVAFTPILETLGINISSLIAAAGIGGLAIGFGAQNLVKDVITGFFILFEDQFQVGDYVETGGKSGIVEEMAIRVTKIRDFNGDLHIIPNGSIDKVTNRSRGNMRALVEVSIAYEENLDRTLEVLGKLCTEIAEENDKIVEGPTVLGVTKLGESDVTISVMAKTIPMEQWAVERELRKRIKERLEDKGIEIPYPRRVVIESSERR